MSIPLSGVKNFKVYVSSNTLNFEEKVDENYLKILLDEENGYFPYS